MSLQIDLLAVNHHMNLGLGRHLRISLLATYLPYSPTTLLQLPNPPLQLERTSGAFGIGLGLVGRLRPEDNSGVLHFHGNACEWCTVLSLLVSDPVKREKHNSAGTMTVHRPTNY